MGLNRYAKKRDISERPIIEALKKAGARVVQLDRPVDLLVCFGGRNHLLEVKNPKGVGGPAGQKLSESQEAWFAMWGGPAHVVRTPEEALRAIGAVEEGE